MSKQMDSDEPSGGLAKVITLPVTAVTTTAVGTVRRSLQRVVTSPTASLDDWGRDEQAVRMAIAIAGLRWKLTVGGKQHLPADGAGLIVVNTRALAQSVVFAAFAIGRSIDRPVRFVGRADANTLGSLSQRLGGLLDDPDEVEGALRAGELVVIGAAPTRRMAGRPTAGIVDHRLIGAAISTGTPVFGAAAVTNPSDRRARIEIAPPISLATDRRGPLHELELADAVQNRIALQLDELGDIGTDTLFDWLPFELLARQLADTRWVPRTLGSLLRGDIG